MRRVSESFAAKLLLSLVGTVGFLFVMTFAAVRSESARQVDAAVASAAGRAEQQLADLETLQHQQVARLGQQVTQSPRTLAALDDAIASGDSGVVGQVVSDQVAVADLSNVLVQFTDPEPRTVVTYRGQQAIAGADPVGVIPVAREVLRGGAAEVSAYRVVDSALYTVSTQLIQLAGRPIGTVSFGLPLRNADVQRVSSLVGAEVCYFVRGACVAGSSGSRTELARAIANAAARPGTMRIGAAGHEWSLRAEALVPGDPAQGMRVIAVPLDGVLAPFHRITDALVIGGGAALAVSLLLGVLLSRGLTRPVHALVDATVRVADGDYTTEVSVRSRDELGRLAGAFNDMTRGLLLKERYRSVLHKVVSRDVAEELMSRDVELGGENREVSVLFADVRGFTALTAGMEPQAVIALLNECMERLSAAVEAEGGVVDKYVGDQIMAVFGAPVAQPAHAARAACAAVRMKRAAEELNALRITRGQPPIGIGIGINTGPVVAGNMGSSSRLNYTVLGETVNLASRLCGAAAAGQILTAARTFDLARAEVRGESAGPRDLKGFATPVEVFAVADATVSLGARRSSGRGMRAILPLVALAAALGMPTAGHAQGGGLPTLQQLGVAYQSPSGFYQVSWSGELDLELLSMSTPQFGLVRGGGTFVTPRARLFTDAFAGSHVYGMLELAADGGEAPTRGLLEGRVEQAYVRISDSEGLVSVQVGRFASPFGPYAGERLTPLDLFVRPPLPDDYRTVMSRTIAAANGTGFETWRDLPEVFRPTGAPPVWQVPYQWGAMAAGTFTSLSYRAAVLNGAPSSEPPAWAWSADAMRHPSYVAALRWAATPSLALEGSFDQGPYLDSITFGALPPGRTRWDYDQYLWAGDLTYARGTVIARGEFLSDRWDVPNAGELAERGYVASLQSDLSAGLFAGARWSYLDFQPWTDLQGVAHDDWDYDVARYEGSMGYRIARNVGLLASVTLERQARRRAPTNSLLGLRWWWAF